PTVTSGFRKHIQTRLERSPPAARLLSILVLPVTAILLVSPRALTATCGLRKIVQTRSQKLPQAGRSPSIPFLPAAAILLVSPLVLMAISGLLRGTQTRLGRLIFLARSHPQLRVQVHHQARQLIISSRMCPFRLLRILPSTKSM